MNSNRTKLKGNRWPWEMSGGGGVVGVLDWIQIYKVEEEGYGIRQDLHIGFVKYLLLPYIYQP